MCSLKGSEIIKNVYTSSIDKKVVRLFESNDLRDRTVLEITCFGDEKRFQKNVRLNLLLDLSY